MAMKAKSKTEVGCMFDRLNYIAGQITLTKMTLKGVNYDRIFSGLGYERNDDGEWKTTGECTLTIEDTYRKQYILLSKKLNDFYNVLDKLPNEKMKRIAELRLIEGRSWKDIAKEMDESPRNVISYKQVLSDHFIQHNCVWALVYDDGCSYQS